MEKSEEQWVNLSLSVWKQRIKSQFTPLILACHVWGTKMDPKLPEEPEGTILMSDLQIIFCVQGFYFKSNNIESHSWISFLINLKKGVLITVCHNRFLCRSSSCPTQEHLAGQTKGKIWTNFPLLYGWLVEFVLIDIEKFFILVIQVRLKNEQKAFSKSVLQ